MTPQTKKVFERMEGGSWYSQEQAFAEKTTFRLSNKIRELESLGYTIGRERVAEGRMDFKYRITAFPKEIFRPDYLQQKKELANKLL